MVNVCKTDRYRDKSKSFPPRFTSLLDSHISYICYPHIDDIADWCTIVTGDKSHPVPHTYPTFGPIKLTSNLQRALNFDFSRYQVTKLFYPVLLLIPYKLINASEEDNTNHTINSCFVLVCISVEKHVANMKIIPKSVSSSVILLPMR
jgi:hypothetical protein